MPAPKSKILLFLTDPRTVIGSIVLGIVFGIYAKQYAQTLAPIGDSYMALLSMSIFPLICAVIIVGLANMLKNPAMLPKFAKLVTVFIASMLICSLLGVFSVLTLKNYVKFSPSSENTLGQTVNSTQTYPVTAPETKSAANAPVKPTTQTESLTAVEKKADEPSKLAYFLKQLTPKNVFAALNEGLTMKVVLILLLIGISLGKSKSEESEYIIRFLDAMSNVFHRIFHWLIYVLPVGLFCMFAVNAASFDPKMLMSFLSIILIIFFVGTVLVLFFNAIVCSRLKMPFYKPFQILKKPILLAFTTMSSTVAVPQSVEILSTQNLEPNAVGLTIPLGITINRQGNVFILAVIAMVTMLFYQVPITFGSISMLVILVGILGSFAFGGGAMLIPVFIIITKTVGIPEAVGVGLLTITDIFVFWINILVTLLANYAATSIVASHEPSPVKVTVE